MHQGDHPVLRDPILVAAKLFELLVSILTRSCYLGELLPFSHRLSFGRARREWRYTTSSPKSSPFETSKLDIS